MPPRLKHGRVLSGKEASGQPNKTYISWPILLPVLGLSLFGLLIIYDASVVVSMSRYGHNFHFVTQQAISLIIGLVGMVIISRVNYQFWLKVSPIVLLVGLLGLLAVFIPGLGVSLGGAHSWLRIGGFQFQPSYPLAIALILYLAHWLSSSKIDITSVKTTLLPFLSLLGLVVFIVAVPQGDMGTAVLISVTCVTVYFLANAPWRHFLMMGPLAGLVGLGLVAIQPYRLERIMTFLGGGAADAQNADYQINQLLIALGSGGLVGQGLGQSRQKYEWLPVVESDSIFAVIGEELGYIGAIAVILVLAYLFWQGYKLSQQAPDEGSRLLVAGIITFIALQACTNLFAAVGLIPLTGVPLPFISSGGTSLMVSLGAIGLILSVARQTPRPSA